MNASGSEHGLARRSRRLLLPALVLLALVPIRASAFLFSFGTVNPTDVISEITLGTGNTLITYTPGTGIMHLETYVSQINFSNGPAPLSGIAPNTVVLTSDIMLVGGSFGVDSIGSSPTQMHAGFMNGVLLDLSIFDNGACAGTPAECTLLEANYIGTLDFTVNEQGSLQLNGELTGDLDIIGGNADFSSAFGPLGALDAQMSSFQSDGFTAYGNLCNIVKANATNYGLATTNCLAGGYALDDFTATTTMYVIPIPEPGTALLLTLGLIGVAALRRK
jgi:hypothetical protein